MNLSTTIEIYAWGSGGTAMGLKTKHHGVMSPHMKKMGGLTHLSHGMRKMGHMRMRASELEADASPSDLASHHTWQEPSATDVTIKQWRNKRVIEKLKGRNMDPFEGVA